MNFVKVLLKLNLAIFLLASQVPTASAQDFLIVEPGTFSPRPGSSFSNEAGSIFTQRESKQEAAFRNLKDMLGDLDSRYFSNCSMTPAKCRFLNESNWNNQLTKIHAEAQERAQKHKAQKDRELNDLIGDKTRLTEGKMPLRPDLKASVDKAIKNVIGKANEAIGDVVAAQKRNETVNIPRLKQEIADKKQTQEKLKEESDAEKAEVKEHIEKSVKEIESDASAISKGILNDLASDPSLDTLKNGVDMGSASSDLLEEGYSADTTGELNGRGQAYILEGAAEQGARLIERANTYNNYKNGATLPYQHAQLSNAALEQLTANVKLTPATFEGYESIRLLNEYSTIPTGRMDDALSFQFGLLATNLVNTLPEAETGRFLSDLENAWAIIDFAKGVTIGVYGSVKGTITGLYQIVRHPIDTYQGIKSAIVNYKKTWAIVTDAAVANYGKLRDCGANPEACGEVVGLVTGEIVQAFYGGYAVKAAANAVKAGRVAVAISETAALLTERVKVAAQAYSKYSRALPKDLGKVLQTSEKIGIETAEELKDFSEFLAKNDLVVETFENSAKKWDSVKSLLHVAKGNYKIAADGTRQLVSGMHTKLGLDNFLKLNQDAGKTFRIQNVTEFTVERIETGGAMLSQTLDNGVRRIQLPRDAWANSDSFNKALVYTQSGQKLKGAKSLFPESWDTSKIGEATNAVKASASSTRQGASITGSYDGVSIKLFVDETDRILTSFPTWRQ